MEFWKFSNPASSLRLSRRLAPFHLLRCRITATATVYLIVRVSARLDWRFGMLKLSDPVGSGSDLERSAS